MGVVIPNIDVKAGKHLGAVLAAVMDISVDEGGPYFFRLQSPSGWKVVSLAQWQLAQKMRVQSTALFLTVVVVITRP